MLRLFCRLILVGIVSVRSTYASSSANDAVENSSLPSATEEWLHWETLPELPDSLGLAGAYVGVSRGVLIVAGGSNFPVSKWDGGEKVYRDAIYVLQPKATAWHHAGQLPRGMAQGAAVSTGESLICLAGRDAEKCYADVFQLTWNPEKRVVEFQSLPPLPGAAYDLSAARIDDQVYVVAGRDDQGEVHRFWRRQLNAAQPDAPWVELPPYPSPARFGAALVAQSDGDHACLYLLGGKHQNIYLKQVDRYDPRKDSADDAWHRCAELPRRSFLPAIAACGQSHLLVIGGSTGTDLDRLEELKDHYRFPKELLAYHTITDTWIRAGEMPEGLVATTAVWFEDRLVIPGGEISPGLRTNRCFSAYVKPSIQSFGVIDYSVLAGYFVAIAAISLYCVRRNKNTTQFLLGGHRIPWWAAGLSLLATQVTAIGIMAIPAKSYATNWLYLTGIATWFVVVPIVNRYIIPFYRKLEITSAYEYLEARFSLGLRLFGSASYSLFQLGRMAVVLYLPALALGAISGIDIVPAVLVMGLLCTLYTVMGGIEAVIWTEVLEAATLLGGVVVCLIAVVLQLDGGIQEFVEVASTHNKFQLADFGWDAMSATLWVVLVGNVFTRLSGLTSDQAVVQRYMTTRDTRTAKMALWTDVAVSVPWALLVFMLGTALFVFYRAHPERLSPDVEMDKIVPFFISQHVPTGIAGLIVASIMVSAMSSTESSMHSVATLCVTDFYGRFWPEASDRSKLWMARLFTLLLGLFGTASAVLLATADMSSIWDFFQSIMGLFVGSLAGLFLLGIFTVRASSTGAVVGVAASVATLFVVMQYTRIHFMLYAAIGAVTCIGVGYLASLILPGRRQGRDLTVSYGPTEP